MRHPSQARRTSKDKASLLTPAGRSPKNELKGAIGCSAVQVGSVALQAQDRQRVSSLYRRRATSRGSFMPITRRLKDKDGQSRWQFEPRHGFAAEFRVVAVAKAESPCIPPTTTPNPSFEARPNGKPPGPGRWYAVHFHRPGPGVLPSVPPQLQR